MRTVCDSIFFYCFNLPRFSLDIFNNFDRLDDWLIKVYTEVENEHSTIDQLKICFLRNLTFEAFSTFFQQGYDVAAK